MVQSGDTFRSGQAFRLGVIEYEDGLRLQNHLAQARGEEKVEDTLLLLQHPPVITMGRSGKIQNLLASETSLQEKGIGVVHTDRGGDFTYHGPGQLVMYPILDLRPLGLSVTDYVWKLEEVVIRVLARFGISAGRVEKLRGVWAGGEKIASLGVHLSRWISTHGVALNVNTDLAPFRLINPCGMTDCQITSMARILGRSLPMEEVESSTLASFAEVFDFSLSEKSMEMLEPYR
jgi:lipoyl(octanoyl) transferase